MTCPRCHSDFEESIRLCPECGLRLVRNVSGVMKTSAVMIAAQGEHGFYRSVQEVPEPLRTQLIETTTSPNSGTIVIADRAGKEQLTQVMARRAGNREEMPASAIAAEKEGAQEVRLRALRLPWLAWGAFVLVLLLGIVFYVLFQYRW
ncbi:MAG TPA: hypothetical protein VG297_21630 [Bryobacteraceae bacterium]|nr:hypothetical protein [Bryobacteraceae bacterium]